MKKALFAFLLAAGGSTLLTTGCSSGGGPSAATAETEFETKIATSIAFDPALLRQGDRVVYFVKRLGETQTQKYTWAVVSDDGGTLWIENNFPYDAGRVVSKTKIDRSGTVLEQWVGEPGGIPGQRYSSAQAGPSTRPVRDSAAAKADSKEDPDRIVVGGKPYDCTRVTTVLSYPDGRKSTMVNWFSKEVPFAATKALGGLVKRQFGRLSMELVAGDRNGKAELQIPPK